MDISSIVNTNYYYIVATINYNYYNINILFLINTNQS